MSLRLKELIPPIAIKYLRYTREYNSYLEAASKCAAVNYQNDTLCNVIAQKTKIHQSKLFAEPFELSSTNVYLLAAVCNFLNKYEISKIELVDYGGACGIHYFETRRFLPEKFRLDWTVVETPQMVLSAKENTLGNNELSFTNDLSTIEKNIDLIYSSCALHYVADPYKELDNLLLKKAKWLFFNRMMFNRADRDIYTVQKSSLASNGPGPLPDGFKNKTIYYPHTTLSYTKFLNKILPYYNLIWKFEEKTGVHPINREDVFGEGLLFELK